MKRTAVYAGSFDPPTNGHLWMIRQGSALFDELVVALAVNPDKPGFFSREERLAVLREMVAELPENVRVEAVNHGFLVDFAREVGATYLLRGMRNTIDFEYEKPMARMNARMEPEIHSVFLMPPSELEEVSSSFVRGFVGVPGWERWVKACVPPCVYRLIEARS
ncbi:MAG: pantetheine-phosphate adenylyltransferase [Akkermansia sp.]|nr:pantetheine-phosphate adenylyltransferase [Akkermansia sp.]MBR1978625.1 pantetheine-phosphate adenylyltransferase [Akkermansia sp.]